MINRQDRKKRNVNYNLARNSIEGLIGSPLTHEIVQNIHGIVMGSNPSPGYRVEGGAPPIINQLTGEIRYLPPDSDVYSMEKLVLELLNSYSKLHSVIEKAATLHWGIVKIHPFDDGNGRTARLLAILTFRNHGYSNQACHQLEKYFEKTRRDYDDSLDDGIFTYRSFDNISQKFLTYLERGINLLVK